jgi:hypothetical protein
MEGEITTSGRKAAFLVMTIKAKGARNDPSGQIAASPHMIEAPRDDPSGRIAAPQERPVMTIEEKGVNVQPAK